MKKGKGINIAVVGLGLIGGSIALSSKERGFAGKVVGVDASTENEQRAMELGIVDEIAQLDIAVKNSDLIILAIPVDKTSDVLKKVLDKIKPESVVMDMGSTKATICASVKNHPNRGRYVSVHPIAGTENSGPEAAFDGLFDHKVAIICDTVHSDSDSVDSAMELLRTLNMRTTEMDCESHDLHIAYVSHLSHISSFTLGQTVLEMEKDEHNIFDMAGSGFESTVRLAKSSPDMWAPILEQNAHNVSKALDTQIKNLQAFKSMIDNRDKEGMHKLMTETNQIRRVLDGIILTKA